MSDEERDTQLLAVGRQCTHPSCLLVDFLPIKCYHCEASFCQDHFRVSAHNCPKYDETKHNRVAPNCPLCHVPVAFSPGQDPNDRMEEHLNTDCTVMTGRAAKSKSPTCARPTCRKVLFAPIPCEKCKKHFCPAHRFPSDHDCTPALSAAPNRLFTQVNPLAKLDTRALNNKAATAGAATLGALKKTMASSTSASQAPTPRPTIPSTTTAASAGKAKPSSSSTPNVFSKTDRRAKAERESQIKAMQAREKKGLLSEAEKAKLATLQAEKKDDCIIM